MNLHITHDNVFIDYIINATKELGLMNENRFVVYTTEKKELRSVKSPEVLTGIFPGASFNSAIGDIKQYRNIFIHWMHEPIVDFVLSIPAGIKVTWCFWGGDGLEVESLLSWIYQPKTYAYFKAHQKGFFHSFSFLGLRKKLYRERQKLSFKRNHLDAMARVDYFAHYLPEDYNRIKSVTPLRAAFVPFHYASLEDIVSNFDAPLKEQAGRDILLGNSDTLSNNHFEAMDQLEQLELDDRKVICPLSYERGDYAHVIAAYGKEKLNGNFIPLLEFMEKKDYDALLANVSVAVMNHNRSQALGNICVLIWNGVKLYMSRESTLYQFFKEKGFKVHSIQDELKPANKLAFEPLPKEDAARNRQLLMQYFGKKAHIEKIKNLLSL